MSEDSEPESKKIKKTIKKSAEKENDMPGMAKKLEKKGIVYLDSDNYVVRGSEKQNLDLNKKSEISGIAPTHGVLPEIFEGKLFFINGDFDKNLKKSLERTIIGFGG